MFYRDLKRGYPRASIDAIRRHGAVPVISLELWHWGDRRRKTASRLPAIVAGEYDAFLRRLATDMAADGGRVLLRFGFEMNGDWFTWSDPALFIRAWRRAHALFREAGATNVEWFWCPNIVPGNFAAYYPGDDEVDWIGLDGYNFGDDHDEWHRWQSFEEVFREPLAELSRRWPGKPIFIGETGSAPGARRAAWIRAAHRWLGNHPRVRALLWFHYDKRREGEPDWRIDSDPESLRAFNETFAAGG